MVVKLALALAVSVAFIANAAAVALPATRRQEDASLFETLEKQAVDKLNQYSLIASAAYCAPEFTASWTCGENCDDLPGFKVTGSGGDGGAIQYWFTAYSATSKSVVIAHQGTDPTEFMSVLTDVKLYLTRPNATLFPYLAEDENVKMHGGFLAAHQLTADKIYDATVRTMADYNTTSITFVGHSLGAALTLLDALSLRLRLPKETKFKVVTYGMPRVGNQGFADAVDKWIPDLTRITNQADPIPIVPGRRLGYVHPHGEIHIDEDLNWNECPGQDSEDEHCTVANVSLLPFQWNLVDHIGYYNGRMIQCWGIDGLKKRDELDDGSAL